MKRFNITGLKLAVIPLLAIALAVVISVFSQSTAFTNASPGLADQGCGACHTSAITCDDCSQCHMPRTSYDLTRTIGMKHHDLSLGFAVPPATTTLDSCAVADCHNNASDARYATKWDANMTNCGDEGVACHNVKPGPGCPSGLCHSVTP
ncbi:hypothetical protein ACFLYS_03350 [Chloroflexota bacterium]